MAFDVISSRGKGLSDDYYSEVIIKRIGKDLFKYDTNENISKYQKFSDLNNYKELKIKEFYYSKQDKSKKYILESYEEIYEHIKGKKSYNFDVKSNFFDIIEKEDKLKYLQYISIFINENNYDKINILIKNLKNLLFLRIFHLVVEDKSIISKNDLLDIINNLSKLCLLEEINIEVIDIDLNKSDEKNILSCIEGIKINKKKNNKTLIQLK